MCIYVHVITTKQIYDDVNTTCPFIAFVTLLLFITYQIQKLLCWQQSQKNSYYEHRFRLIKLSISNIKKANNIVLQGMKKARNEFLNHLCPCPTLTGIILIFLAGLENCQRWMKASSVRCIVVMNKHNKQPAYYHILNQL